MNLLHRWYCGSLGWITTVQRDLLPWALDGVDLGQDTLELGPGRGASTRALAARATRLTAIEIDADLALSLRGRTPPETRLVCGDATRLPFASASFTSVIAGTMLHHIGAAALQDRLFQEARRVLRPGGVFAGFDTLDRPGLRLSHLGDALNLVDPGALDSRLQAAGFRNAVVERNRHFFRFSARV